MRLFTSAVSSTIAIGLLAGCAGNMGSSNASPLGLGPQARTAPISVFDDAPPRVVSVLHSLVLPDKKRKKPKTGIYVSQFDAADVFGYPIDNMGNKKPVCQVGGVLDVNGVGVDGKGNLMVPNPSVAGIDIHKGPDMCGKLIGSIADNFGQPSDATSPNAVTGNIAVGNLDDGGSSVPGSLSICTLTGGCAVNLTNGHMYHAGGVAMSNSGDCWVDPKTSASGGAALIYFKGCAGGAVASGFKPTYYGGMDIDNSGNLVVIDDMAEMVYIYSGCNPKCKAVGGPFPLKGETFFGKLNSTNSQYVAVDRTDALVDVYSYSTKKIKFLYSFNSSLVGSDLPDGVAIDPRSKE